jgi:altronate dehydratase small subunit
MHAKPGVIVINEKDNVATALEELAAGATVSVRVEGRMEQIRVLSRIPRGHKFALRRIGQGGAVIKYGETIGVSTAQIAAGEHVHVHNVVSPPKGGAK